APGPDPGADEITARLARWRRTRDGVTYVASLGARFPGVLRAVDVVVGNSSSGVIEAPTARVASVDVGRRQQGRPKASSIIVAPEPADIAPALASALSDAHRIVVDATVNPYGDGNAAARTADVLAAAPLERLRPKRFHYEGSA